MLATIAYVVAGLSTGHKIGLATVGILFMLFALISSFALPARNKNFPGDKVWVFVGVTALFFVAMMSAVLIFGKESKEAEAASAGATTTTAATTTAGATTTSSAPTGDATAGKALFTSASCAGCHTLKAANATGTVGPNLDALKPSLDAIVHQVENGGGPMPAFKDQLTAQQIQDVAAFVYASTHS